jgi:glycine cleavage system H protein
MGKDSSPLWEPTFMTDILEFTVNKFIFTVPTDRLYHPAGLWVQERDGRLLVGVTDFFQQNSGDVAFAEVAESGTAVAINERLANVETIKVDVELPAPVSGTVVEVNKALELEAERINQAPYNEGWLAVIEPSNWPVEQTALMSAKAYYDFSHAQALEEIGKK